MTRIASPGMLVNSPSDNLQTLRRHNSPRYFSARIRAEKYAAVTRRVTQGVNPGCFMRKGVKNRLIAIPVSLLLFLGGLGLLQVAQQFKDDLAPKVTYALFAIFFMILSIGLLLLVSKICYIVTAAVCSIYIIFFAAVTVHTLNIDKTGQGLVGLFFIAPQAAISLVAAFFSIYKLKA